VSQFVRRHCGAANGTRASRDPRGAKRRRYGALMSAQQIVAFPRQSQAAAGV